MTSLQQPPSLRSLVATLWKRRWALTSIVALTLLIAGVYVLIIRDDLYMVSTRIMVKLGREQAAPATVLGSGPQVIGYRTAEVNTETEIFQSRQLYEQLVTDLGLDRPGKPAPPPAGLFQNIRYHVKAISKAVSNWKDEMLIRAGLRPRLTERQKVIAQLQESIGVQAAPDSNVFVATFATPFREGGSLVLNRQIDNYLKYRQSMFAEAGSNLFADETSRTSNELESAESQLQSFEQQFQISSYDKQKEVLIERLSQAEAAEKETGLYLNDAEGKVRRMEAALATPNPNFGTIGDFPTESLQRNLVNQLADLERERELLRLKELDSSDKIRNNREQFKVIAGMLEGNLRASLEERRVLHDGRARERDALRKELEDLHTAQVQWTDLKRRVSDLENHNLFYRRKLEETRANDSMNQRDMGNVVVIERPGDPIQPVGIRKTTLLMISALVALVLGLAWITILELFDTRVDSPGEVERYLGKPVFAVFGEHPRFKFSPGRAPLTPHGPS